VRNIPNRTSVAAAIGAIAALPVAAMTKLSLVDVSPSTVAPLNETSATSRASAASSGAATGASVAMNARSPSRMVRHPWRCRHRHRNAIDHDAPRRAFRHRVRRHDRFRGIEPAVGACGDTCRGKRVDDPLHRQRLHDDARRIRENLLRSHADKLSRSYARRTRIGEPTFPRARVRVARIDDKRAKAETARMLAREMSATNDDRRRAESVLREHAGGDRAGIGDDQDHVIARPVLDPRRGGSEHDARHRRQRFGGRRRVADGHGASLRDAVG
jgi:hypothetical protein